MEQGQLIVACDFGTTAFRVLVVNVSHEGMRVVGAGSAESVGFRDGDFVDLTSASRALERAVTAAESAADVDISGFFFSVSGSHLRSVWARCQQQIGPERRPITPQDVDLVIDKAHGMGIPFDHAILVANPVGFTVDGIAGVVDPVGRAGSHLEADVHIVTGSSTVLQNIESAIGKLNREAVGWCVDVLASSAVLLDDAAKDAGAALVDIGGSVTQWALFHNGEIAGCGQVPWGGEHLTADLAHGLRVSMPEAEAVKRSRGVVLRSLTDAIDPDVLFEEDAPAESPGLIATVLEPRLEEILALVKKDMAQALGLGDLRGGLVITGGGSRCAGTDDLAEQVFQLPVTLRYLPANIAGTDRLPPGQWGTALGLAAWAVGDSGHDEDQRHSGGGGGLKGILKKIWPRR